MDVVELTRLEVCVVCITTGIIGPAKKCHLNQREETGGALRGVVMIVRDDIEQLDEEWMELRIGSIGGSSISSAIAKGEGKTRQTLMWDFVEEIISGEKKSGFVSWDMREGLKWEPRGRLLYELKYLTPVKQIALVKHSEHKHYSPDGWVNDNGMIEIKRAILPVFQETREKRNIPTDRRRQMQWGLFICEREWCDYVMYCPYIEKKVDPLLVIRVERDEKEIKELDKGANLFIEEMQSLLIKVMKRG